MNEASGRDEEAWAEAVRRAADAVHVPGAPRSLALDHADVRADRVRLRWSYVDPEARSRDRGRPDRRVHGELVVPLSHARGDARDEVASGWWAEVQLAAAHRYRQQVDADWTPGEPYVPRTWTVDEAWHALRDHLAQHGEVHDAEDGLRVVTGTEQIVYRIDPAAWAAYLTDPEPDETTTDGDVVPAATPLTDGLPLWVTDELVEIVGADEPAVVELGDRGLVGRDD